ncbi:MAG: hypothetical protein ACPF8V_03745, partial [Luteibaculum sp.]
MKLLAFYAAAALLILTSCTKCEEKATFEIFDNVRPITRAFQPGNWWIYANRDSSIVDSLWVSQTTAWNYTKTEKCNDNRAISGTHKFHGSRSGKNLLSNADLFIGDYSTREEGQNFIVSSTDLSFFLPLFEQLKIEENGNYVYREFMTGIEHNGRIKDSSVFNRNYNTLITDRNGLPVLDMET